MHDKAYRLLSSPYIIPKSHDLCRIKAMNKSFTKGHNNLIINYHFYPGRLRTGQEWGRTWLRATITLLANSLWDEKK